MPSPQIAPMTSSPVSLGRRRTLGLVALLGAAMATATYLQGALSVISSFLIDEFEVTRSQLGAAFTAFSLTGAVASPGMGALTDRGPKRVMAALFGLGIVSVLVISISPSFAMLMVGCVIGGIALGAGNPVTNRVISEQISRQRRGLVVGLKQAGPPLSLMGAGVILPPLALAVGWRWAMMASVALPAAGLIATWFLLQKDESARDEGVASSDEDQAETRSIVIWLTVISLGAALGLSAVIAFVPLYAQERIGASPAMAGTLAAVLGFAGVVGRIVWGAVGGRFARPSTALIIISTISFGATLAVLLAETLGILVLWFGVLVAGGSMMAWHAVGWLTIIDLVGARGVGKASGVMQIGNSIGFAFGPPMAGVIVDVTGSYGLAWGAVAVIFAVSTILTFWIRARG